MFKIKLSVIPLTYQNYIKENKLSYNETTLREWEQICFNLGFKPTYKKYLKKYNLLDTYESLQKWEQKISKKIHKLDKLKNF